MILTRGSVDVTLTHENNLAVKIAQDHARSTNARLVIALYTLLLGYISYISDQFSRVTGHRFEFLDSRLSCHACASIILNGYELHWDTA